MTVRGLRSAVLAVATALCGLLVATGTARATVLHVSTTRDEILRHDGACSLREAIAAVNSSGSGTDCGAAGRRANTIVLSRGDYVLSVTPAGPDDNTSGDLNLAGRVPLTLRGAGTGATVIDAGGLGDRVISVGGGARLTLVRLTITGGHPSGAAAGGEGSQAMPCGTGPAGQAGGGIFNSGTVTLNAVKVSGNHAAAGGAGCAAGTGGPGGSGGGLYSRGTLTVIDSTIEGNTAGRGGAGGAGAPSAMGPAQGAAGGPGGSGGGIYSRGKLTVTASTISGNRAGAGGLGGQGAGGGAPGFAGSAGLDGSGGGIFSSVGRLRLINDTLFHNAAGAGDAGSGLGGPGGPGDGGAVAVVRAPSLLLNDTVAENGAGGGLFVTSGRRAEAMRLQNTIVASNAGPGCVAAPAWAITDGGHDLSYGDGTCPGRQANPRLRGLKNYGGPTKTIALGAGSAAVGRVPRRGGGCPATDQRGVVRPQGKGCDIGAYEFAVPKITILAPFHGASYERGARIRARFRCGEGGVRNTIAVCEGSVTAGRRIETGHPGRAHFTVTAVDRSGTRARKTIRYGVWEYVDPLRRVSGLTPRRIDLGVDYAGSGPLLAIGRGRVTTASDTDSGPQSCWAISCWPGGGIVVYRLLDGPFAGRYVYVAEHLTVTVRVGQTVRPGQQVATLYAGYPWSEWGWAAGPGPEALAMADGHRCTCSDPGGWSTIEGRNMDDLLVRLGAPSGYLQPGVPDQSMPSGWPTWPR
jgi:CSLREA domain-containing protein